MESSLVSVIIPAYKAEKHIRNSVCSVLNQSYKRIEVIIIVDGSEDNTLTVAKSLASSQVKVVYQRNKGAGAARNRGLREAQGDFVQYMDADDVISSKKVEEQVKILSSDPSCVSVCSTVYFFDGEDYTTKTNKPSPYLYDTDDTADFLVNLWGGYNGVGGMIQPNAYLIPREISEKAGPWEEFYSPDDDGEYFCRILLNSDGIRVAQNGINYYRKYRTGNSLSRRSSRRAWEGGLQSLDLKAKSLLSRIDSLEAKFAISRQYLEYAVLCYPAHRDLSSKAMDAAKRLGAHEPQYVGGGKGQLIAKFLGWRVARLSSYFMHGI